MIWLVNWTGVIKIIDESFELIKTAEAQKTMLKENVAGLEKKSEDLQKYRQTIIEESANLPESLRRLNEIIVGNVDSEIQDNKNKMAINRWKLTIVSNKLKKKLVFTLGENFTAEEKDEYLEQLQKQKTEIEKEIKKVQAKKDTLVRILQAQYDAEQKAELHSVPKLTEVLTKKILGTVS